MLENYAHNLLRPVPIGWIGLDFAYTGRDKSKGVLRVQHLGKIG